MHDELLHYLGDIDDDLLSFSRNREPLVSGSDILHLAEFRMTVYLMAGIRCGAIGKRRGTHQNSEGSLLAPFLEERFPRIIYDHFSTQHAAKVDTKLAIDKEPVMVWRSNGNTGSIDCV